MYKSSSTSPPLDIYLGPVSLTTTLWRFAIEVQTRWALDCVLKHGTICQSLSLASGLTASRQGRVDRTGISHTSRSPGFVHSWTVGRTSGRKAAGWSQTTRNKSRQFTSFTAGYLLICCSSTSSLHSRLASSILPVFASGLDVEHALKALEEKYIEFPWVWAKTKPVAYKVLILDLQPLLVQQFSSIITNLSQ